MSNTPTYLVECESAKWNGELRTTCRVRDTASGESVYEAEVALTDQAERESFAAAAAEFIDATGAAKEIAKLLAEKLKDARKRGEGSPALLTLADVAAEPVDWLWHNRIPLGKITLLAGDPGLGKSMLSLSIAATVSRGGDWPDASEFDGPAQAGKVLLIGAEDGLADTIRPRLDAAGADVANVLALEGVRSFDGQGKPTITPLNLRENLPTIARALEQEPEIRLIVIDPISAFLGQTDSHSNAEVRALLHPLSELATAHRVALLLVAHLNKGTNSSKAVYRLNGSLAFPAAARVVWLVCRDQADAQRRLFLPVKNNLADDQKGLAFQIEAGRVVWEAGPVEQTADDAMSEPDRANKCDEAQEWLRELLTAGPMTVGEVEAEAEGAGIAKRTLRRAREELGIRPYKAGYQGAWLWALPGVVGGGQ